jgi:hypothetical protein
MGYRKGSKEAPSQGGEFYIPLFLEEFFRILYGLRVKWETGFGMIF